LAKQIIQVFATQMVQAATGQHYSIDGGQIVFMPKSFSNLSFDPVALVRFGHIFFCNHQTQSRVAKGIGACQHQ
jgi:cytochrome bd-type quinol oxidase subunit 1